jgi:hypothetical protein
MAPESKEQSDDPASIAFTPAVASGFYSAARPLFQCELTVSPKNTRCLICGEKVLRDSTAYRIAFVHVSDHSTIVHEACIEHTEFSENKRRFETNSYSLSQFDNQVVPWSYEPIKELLKDFDLKRALDILGDPPDWSNREDSPAQFPELIGVLSKCGFNNALVSAMAGLPGLPKYVLPLLALRDEDAFQKEAARIFDLPQLPEALNRLRKRRLTLEDIMFVARCATHRPQFLAALSGAIVKYCLDESYTLSCAKPLGFSGFDMVRQAQLCYFFILQPHLLPRFELFIETGNMSEHAPDPILLTASRLLAHFTETGNKSEYAPTSDISAEESSRRRDRGDRFMYAMPAYYRAAILHFITAGKKSEAQRWIDQMTIKVTLYPSGDAAGFIRDTFKMASKLGSREGCEVQIPAANLGHTPRRDSA